MNSMRKVSIISDSTCDLSKELLEKYNISTFPLHIHLGEEQYSDGVDITPEEIYAWSDKNNATPKTSTLSPLEAEEFLNKHLEGGNEVICFCISETMSSCANVMRMAAMVLEKEDKVFVVDSANLSTGIGLQLIDAAIMADSGMEAAEIVEKIKALQPKVRSSFVVDTLTYLHRGGRCSGLAAMVGGTLGLHPCISVVDGKMQAGKKYRGRMAKIMKHYIDDLRPELEDAKRDRVFITHSGCDEEIINLVKAQLEELNRFDEILITRAGSVVTSHCGPGTLGVLYIAG
ncbi:MAG: DegV family protein [Clostridia bacterium]|nr:DegV family protein [Clostridia bacterium]